MSTPPLAKFLTNDKGQHDPAIKQSAVDELTVFLVCGVEGSFASQFCALQGGLFSSPRRKPDYE